jgi:cleavage stimulation factor subunit 3
MFAYEQCLLSLSYHPDIWYDAANYLHQMSINLAEKGNVALSKQFADEASNLYERAINSFMKNNMLIYFAYADFEEVSVDYLLE